MTAFFWALLPGSVLGFAAALGLFSLEWRFLSSATSPASLPIYWLLGDVLVGLGVLLGTVHTLLRDKI